MDIRINLHIAVKQPILQFLQIYLDYRASRPFLNFVYLAWNCQHFTFMGVLSLHIIEQS